MEFRVLPLIPCSLSWYFHDFVPLDDNEVPCHIGPWISLSRSCFFALLLSASTSVFQPSFGTRSILSSSSQTAIIFGYLILKAFAVPSTVLWCLNYHIGTSFTVRPGFLRSINFISCLRSLHDALAGLY